MNWLNSEQNICVLFSCMCIEHRLHSTRETVLYVWMLNQHFDAELSDLVPLHLLLFGNSQMKNKVVSHSTWAHVPVFSSPTQLEFVVGANLDWSCSSWFQAENMSRGLELASKWLVPFWRWEIKTEIIFKGIVWIF